jgi:hypothetical protein
MQRIKPSELGLQRITASSSLPRFVPESWLRQFTRSPDCRDAMEWFLAGPSPTRRGRVSGPGWQGPGRVPGAHVLLDELEKLALDEGWAYFFRWLLLGPYGANVRNEVAHGFVFDISSTYAALTLRAVSVLVTVAGPPVPHTLGPDAGDEEREDVASRDRTTVLGLLASPLASAGWIDRPSGWAGRQLDRAWWWVQMARASSRLRRSRRSHGDSA